VSSARRFGYAQARIQARLAALPSAADWQRLSGARALSGYLEEARDGTLRTWVKGFSGQSDCHDLERGLRAQFIDTVEQAAGFVPEPWRAAVRWCRWLPLLPLFAHLRAGAALPGWTRRDYRLSELLDERGGLDGSELRRLGLEGLLRSDGGDIAADWGRAWRARWPSPGRSDRAALEALAARIDAHLGDLRSSAPDKAWQQRRALRDRLRLELHRRLLQPVAVFLYLGLVALDLERLRAALVERVLFAPVGEGGG